MTPPWKIFEDPGIFVSLEPIPPPVHDSATAIVSCLFSNNLNTDSSRVILSTPKHFNPMISVKFFSIGFINLLVSSELSPFAVMRTLTSPVLA